MMLEIRNSSISPWKFPDLMKKGGSCEWIQPPTMNGVTTSLTLLTMMPGEAGSWRVIRATRFPSRKKVLS